jgi:antirestriction protein ArdC
LFLFLKIPTMTASGAAPGPQRFLIARNQLFDALVAATGAVVVHGGDRAFYRPSTDSITMPDESRLCGTEIMTRDESYISVHAQEFGHNADLRIMPRRRMVPRRGAQFRGGLPA